MADTMKIEILDDGKISVQTDEISQKNHYSADEFLAMIEDLAGGERKTTPKKRSHSMALRSRDRLVKTFQK
jgi:hypothetical protein